MSARRLAWRSRWSWRSVLALTLALGAGCNGSGEGARDGGGAIDAGAPGIDARPIDGDAGPPVGEVFLTQRHTFAGEASSTRPHQWAAFYLPERPVYQHLADREGACELWRFGVAQCDEPCDGLCVAPGRCVAFEWSEAGDVAVVGGASATLTTNGGWYQFADPPEPSLLLAGQVSITAAGGAIGAFAQTLPMPAPLDVDLPDPVVLDDDAGWTITWTPEPGGTARVRLEILSADASHGSVRSVILRCEVADAAGLLVVAPRLVAQLPELETTHFGLCPGAECPPSTLARVHTARLPTPQGIVDLVVGHEFAFWPRHEVLP